MRLSSRPFLLAVLGFFMVALFATDVSAEPPENADIYKKVLRGTAWVINQNYSGTAWIVDRDKRLLITNFHVVALPDKEHPSDPPIVQKEVKLVFPVFDYGELVSEKKYYRERFDKLAVNAKVIATELEQDLAIIEAESLPAGAKELTLLKSKRETTEERIEREGFLKVLNELLDELEEGSGEYEGDALTDEPKVFEPGKRVDKVIEPGESVHSVGNPGASGALWVYSSGTVRSVYKMKFRSDSGPHEFTVLETQAPINSGDSGGPVVNDDGFVVGIVQSHNPNARLVSLCIHVSELKKFLDVKQKALNPVTASDYLSRGNTHFDKDEYDSAITYYDKAIELDPRLADAYCVRGQSYGRKGDHDRAIQDLDKAISLESDNGLYYGARGKAYALKEEYSLAAADYNRAITHGYKEPGIYYSRAFCYKRLKQYEWAIADYTRAISFDHRRGEAYCRRGYCLDMLGRRAEALQDYHKAVPLTDPDSASGRNVRERIQQLQR